MERHAEWEKLTDQRLIEKFDAVAPSTVLGVGFIREELHRREMKRQGERIERMTARIEYLTWVIAGLTLILLAAELLGGSHQ